MKKIIINKVEHSLVDMFTRSRYEKKGFYEANGQLVFVNDHTVMFICFTYEVEMAPDAKETKQAQEGISEDFVLKLLAITLNKENFKEVDKNIQ